MKVESRTILGASIFLIVLCGVYWWLVEMHGASSERSGITMLVFSFSAYGMLGLYLLAQFLRRKGHPRPEDSFEAEQHDGEGLVGYFPVASMWPAGLALGMLFGAAALVWGLWYLFIGVPLFFGSVLGWVVESDHTEYIESGTSVEDYERDKELGHH